MSQNTSRALVFSLGGIGSGRCGDPGGLLQQGWHGPVETGRIEGGLRAVQICRGPGTRHKLLRPSNFDIELFFQKRT